MLLRLEVWMLAALTIAGITGCAHRGHAGGGASPAIPGANLSRGQLVYARECEACHGRDGIGGPIGPALRDEHLRRSFEAVRAIVADPQPPMPKLYPGRLSQSDVRSVSAYVESL